MHAEGVVIPLRRRDGYVIASTIIDGEDASTVTRHRWYLGRSGYAVRSERVEGRVRQVLLHRFILGLAHGDPRVADHIDRNKLDNRHANLRAVTLAESAQNKSPRVDGASRFRGVLKSVTPGKWLASARVDGVVHHLGTFSDEEEAARVAAVFRAEHMPYSEEALA